MGPWGGTAQTVASGTRGVISSSAPTLSPLCPTEQCFNYCENNGVCQMTKDGVKQCRCPPQFEGAQCQDNKCSRCQEGKCNINRQSGEVSCMYVPRCWAERNGRVKGCEGACMPGMEGEGGTHPEDAVWCGWGPGLA